MSDEYTADEIKINGNQMYGGKRHDEICDYFESSGYSEKEVNDISMGIWKGIESERLKSKSELDSLKYTNAKLVKCLKWYADGNGDSDNETMPPDDNFPFEGEQLGKRARQLLAEIEGSGK